MSLKRKQIRNMVYIALFGALAGVIQAFEFPVPFLPPFYAIDFSWAIVVLGGFILGPFAAIGIELLKVIIFLLIHGSQTAFVGEMAMFVMGIAFTLPVTIMFKKNQTFKSVLVGLGTSIISLTIVGALANYYFLLPAFSKGLQIPIDSIVAIGHQLNPKVNGLLGFVLLMTIPFNLLKSVLNSVVVGIIYPKVSKFINK